MLKKIQRESKIKLFIASLILVSINIAFGQINIPLVENADHIPVTLQQVKFDANNISTWIINTGIFNQDLSQVNFPGFEWPKGTGKYAIFTSGLCIGAYVNNELREAMASYKGEYAPGYVMDSAGHTLVKTDFRFKIYKVKHGDSYITNPDWLNWGLMVPFGAPYIDVNHNGTYEPMVDTPGIKGAVQTLFCCLTDGFPDEHKIGEGFGGGTLPLYAELHLTAWAYTSGCLNDVQFFKWVVINRSHSQWNKTYFAIFSDCDLGMPNDDYNGCDTTLQIGYTYNGEDMDGTGNGVSYGLHPPAVGMILLNSPVNRSVNPPKKLNMSSFVYVTGTSTAGPQCEKDANGEPLPAYNFMKGIKKDETPWVIPPGGSSQYITKYCYSGNPETGQGWNEGIPGNPSGSVQNCGGPGVVSGTIVAVNYFGDRRFILGSGADNFTVNPGDTQTIVMAQLIARGTDNLNSVTKLKLLAQCVWDFYNQYIGIKPISSSVPRSFELYQNYPNPFNPSTKIKFEIRPPLSPLLAKEGTGVVLKIYDILGREVTTLINEQLKPGAYEVEFDGTNYPSGVYFYKLTAGEFTETKRMVLIK
ncbi:MAG: T9SS type A sorting domain-containing protein [Ignavibacteria bacterium]